MHIGPSLINENICSSCSGKLLIENEYECLISNRETCIGIPRYVPRSCLLPLVSRPPAL